MAKTIFLYPTLTDEMKEGIFQARKYTFSYTDNNGEENILDYEAAEISSAINCIKTDGVWDADKNNLIVNRTIALKSYRKLFGPAGIVCRTAKLGIAVVWTSKDSKQRGAKPVMVFGVSDEELSAEHDRTFIDAELHLEFMKAQLRGDVTFSVTLYLAEAGTPGDDELHLANEDGFILGELDKFTVRLDGTGSLFPIFEVHEKEKPLWYVRCDWSDPVSDSFSETVSININTAHKNYKYIDQTQKTFCAQLLVEVMSAALCCIIEKVCSEKYIEQILGTEEMDPGSIGETLRYFSETLGWDFSSPENLSVSTRKFFDRRMSE